MSVEWVERWVSVECCGWRGEWWRGGSDGSGWRRVRVVVGGSGGGSG